MEIHVQLAGVKLGPYTPRQVRDHLADGLLALSDLGRLEGSDEWICIGDILAKAPADEPEPSASEKEPVPAANEAESVAASTLLEIDPVEDVKPEVKEETELPVSARASEDPVVSDSPVTTSPTEATAAKHETAPLSMPLVVKSLLKKNNQESKPAPGPVSLMSTAPKTAETPAPSFQAPLKVLTRKPEADTKPKNKAVLVPPIKVDTTPGPVNPGKASERTTGMLPIVVLGKKPEAKAGSSAIELADLSTLAPTAQPAEGTPLTSMARTLVKKPERNAKITMSALAPLAEIKPAVTAEKAVEKEIAPAEKAVEKPAPPATKEPISLAEFKKEPMTPAASPEAAVSQAAGTAVPAPMTDASPAGQPKGARVLPVRRGYVVVGLILLGVAIILGWYIRSSYLGLAALRSAITSGDQAQLEAAIDFTGLRASLKEQFHDQLTKAGVRDASGNPVAAPDAVYYMVDYSIDYYLTPDGLSHLISNPGTLVPSNQVIIPEVAARILSGLNEQEAKTEGLISPMDFAVELETVRLHLQFYGTGWKLNRLELLTDVQMPTPKETPPAPAPSTPVPTPTPVPVPTPPAPTPAPVPPSPTPAPTPAPATTTTAPTPAAAAVAPEPGPSLTSSMVETYLSQGKAKYQKNDLDGAIGDFSKAVSLAPKNSVAYYDRGAARQAKGDLAGAVADFSKALEIEPTLPLVYFSRGKAEADQRNADAALADFAKAIEEDPKFAPVYFERGKVRALKGDRDGAIDDFTQSLQFEPNQAAAYSDRGFARQAKNDLEGAVADYTQALALNPNMAGAYFNRGCTEQLQGNLDGAILDFDQALKLDPKMTRAYFNRGTAKSAKRDWEGAVADYNQAIALDPSNAVAYCQRGVAKEARNDIPGAMADFTQTINRDPKIATAYYYRGLLRERNGDFDGAIADSSKAIEMDSKQAQAYYNRGFARLSKGIPAEASSDLHKFCELSPHDQYADHARLYLWLIAKSQGPKEDADGPLSHALQNNWNSPSDDFVSKLANFLLGTMSEAELISSAISSDPQKDQSQHCEAWYFAGMKRLLDGDRDMAIDYFQRCIATGQKEFCEYLLAQTELKVLPTVAKAPATGTEAAHSMP